MSVEQHFLRSLSSFFFFFGVAVLHFVSRMTETRTHGTVAAAKDELARAHSRPKQLSFNLRVCCSPFVCDFFSV